MDTQAHDNIRDRSPSQFTLDIISFVRECTAISVYLKSEIVDRKVLLSQCAVLLAFIKRLTADSEFTTLMQKDAVLNFTAIIRLIKAYTEKDSVDGEMARNLLSSLHPLASTVKAAALSNGQGLRTKAYSNGDILAVDPMTTLGSPILARKKPIGFRHDIIGSEITMSSNSIDMLLSETSLCQSDASTENSLGVIESLDSLSPIVFESKALTPKTPVKLFKPTISSRLSVDAVTKMESDALKSPTSAIFAHEVVAVKVLSVDHLTHPDRYAVTLDITFSHRKALHILNSRELRTIVRDEKKVQELALQLSAHYSVPQVGNSHTVAEYALFFRFVTGSQEVLKSAIVTDFFYETTVQIPAESETSFSFQPHAENLNTADAFFFTPAAHFEESSNNTFPIGTLSYLIFFNVSRCKRTS